jgi:signal transduction histidine kinase/CheY-like chemotaxis protein
MATLTLGPLSFFRNYFAKHELLLHIVIFLLLFSSLKFSQFINISNLVVIFPTVGIALAAALLGGNRMMAPIFFAYFFAVITRVPPLPLVTAFTTIVAYTFQPLIGAYFLKRIGLSTKLVKTRDALVLIGGAFFLPTIAPSLIIGASMFFGTHTASVWLNWGNAWAGGLLSIMIATPLLLTWLTEPHPRIIRRKYPEKILVMALLTTSILLPFWTASSTVHIFLNLYLFFGILFWIGLRMGPRMMTLALFITALLSVAVTLIDPSDIAMNGQFLSIELFIILIAPFFLILTSLVEELRTAFQKLEENYEATLAANKAKSQFIAILAHELRNPLAPIISSLEFLKIKLDKTESQETLENALEHTMMMRRLLDDLLDMARLVQNKITLRKENVRLRQIIKQSLASVADLVEAKHHTVTTELPPDDFKVHVDPVRLKQIIINLLNNACKYTPHGGLIRVSYGLLDGQFFVSVKDNGIGISHDILDHIFEPFQQGEGSIRYGSGLGIGLFLTRTLVQMHGGHIEVESEGPHKGSMFRVFIPYAQSNPLSPSAYKMKQITDKTLRILIVDDNEAAANILQKLLRIHKHETEVSYSGEDALLKIASFNPEAILLDIGMPQMDGYETARQIHKLNWHGAMIALSGYGQESDKEKSRNAGFDDHLIKPAGIEDILSALERIKVKQGKGSR